jgi:hypothetical protein
MTAYRTREKHEPSESDRETEALRDLLARMKRLRRRVALPTLVASLVVASIGMSAHALGYWSVVGMLSNGTYLIGAVTFLIAAVICSAPVLGPGVAVYLLARMRLRRAWQEQHREKGVSKEWLAENVRRFG